MLRIAWNVMGGRKRRKMESRTFPRSLRATSTMAVESAFRHCPEGERPSQTNKLRQDPMIVFSEGVDYLGNTPLRRSLRGWGRCGLGNTPPGCAQ